MVRPKVLYKFATPDRADVLEAGFIRFTQPGALNDPFELQPLFEHLLTEAQLRDAARPPFEMVEEALYRRHSELPPAQQEQFPAEVLAEILRANPLVLERLTAGVVPTLRKVVADFAPRARRMLVEPFVIDHRQLCGDGAKA